MSLVQFVLLALSLYALLAFAALPRLEQRFRLERTSLNIRYAALLAVLGVARGVCLIATATGSVLIAIMYYLLHLKPGITATEIGQMISTLQHWRAYVVGFGPYWGSLVAVVLIVGLGIFAYRSGKRRMEKAFQAVFDREFERVRQEAQEGRLELLPETPEMQTLSAQIAQTEERLRALLEASNVPTSLREQAQQQYYEKIITLRHHYMLIDVRRRMDMRLDPDMADLPQPCNWWERVQTFLISRGLLSALERGSQIFYLASMILLVPCLMGVYSPSIVSPLEAQIVAFHDLQLDLTQQQALDEWHKAEQKAQAEQQKAEEEATEQQTRQEQQTQSHSHQTVRGLLRTIHVAERSFEQARQARTRAPEPLSPRTMESGTVQQAEMHTLEKRQSEELHALEARQAQEQEALRQRQAERVQQQQQQHTAQQKDLASRQQTERGRDVPAKATSRNHVTPQQWQEAQVAAAQHKSHLETEQVSQRLHTEAEAIQNQFAAKIDERLTELNRTAVAQRFQDLQSKMGPPVSQLTAADEAVLREAAQHYERAAAASWQELVPERLSNHEVQALAARDQILQRAANHVPTGPMGPGLQVQPSMSRLENLPIEQKFVLQAAEHLVDPKAGLSATGQRAYTYLEDAAQRKPSLIGVLKQQLHNFQEPVSRRTLSNRLMVNTMAMFLSVQSPELGVMAQGVEREVNRVALEHALDTRLQESLTDLFEHNDLPSALKKMAQGHADHPVMAPVEHNRLKESMRVVFERMPAGQEIATAMHHHPPSVVDIPEPHVKLQQAGEYVAGWSQRLDRQHAAQIAFHFSEPLTSYDDFFPGQLGAETRTHRGQILERLRDPDGGLLGGGLPGGPAGRGSGPGGGFSGGAAGGGSGPGGGFSGGPTGGRTGPGGGAPRSGPTAGEGGTGGLRVSKATPPVSMPKQTLTNFARARSFGALRGFARVGGVLIGQDAAPDKGEAMDFRDLRWEGDEVTLRLLLIDAQGQVQRSRPFRKRLIYHALTYAADGRPLTVTMVKANPLPELRILVHPVLVDTPLGYRMIELDRFVDRFTTGKAFPDRDEAIRLVENHVALYRLAWAQRALVLLHNEGFAGAAQVFKVPASELDQQRAEARKTLADQTLRAAALQAIQEPKLWQDGKRSPLTVKKEFFDATLVQLITDSLEKQNTPQEFLDRLQANTQVQIQTLVQGYHKAWQDLQAVHSEEQAKSKVPAVKRAFYSMLRCIEPVPEFEIWSGVREHPYSARLDAIFPSDGKPLPIPFQFMLQIAFTSAPWFLADSVSQEQLESYTDKTPWEFPALRDAIQNRVLENVSHNAVDKAILEDAAEFAILQRLFRVALQGKLGKDFPMEKLVALTDATAPAQAAVRVRTPRWNSAGGQRAFVMEKSQLKQLTGLLQKLAQESLTEQEGQIKEGLTILLGCRDLLGERGRHFQPLQETLQNLLETKQTTPPTATDLQKYRALSADWQQFQDDWLQRWATTCDLQRFLSQSNARSAGEESPGNDNGRLFQQAISLTEMLGLVLQMRHQLGVYVDDQQSLEELVQARVLPPL